jgi:hypothetical protein
MQGSRDHAKEAKRFSLLQVTRGKEVSVEADEINFCFYVFVTGERVEIS